MQSTSPRGNLEQLGNACGRERRCDAGVRFSFLCPGPTHETQDASSTLPPLPCSGCKAPHQGGRQCAHAPLTPAPSPEGRQTDSSPFPPPPTAAHAFCCATRSPRLLQHRLSRQRRAPHRRGRPHPSTPQRQRQRRAQAAEAPARAPAATAATAAARHPARRPTKTVGPLGHCRQRRPRRRACTQRPAARRPRLAATPSLVGRVQRVTFSPPPRRSNALLRRPTPSPLNWTDACPRRPPPPRKNGPRHCSHQGGGREARGHHGDADRWRQGVYSRQRERQAAASGGQGGGHR